MFSFFNYCFIYNLVFSKISNFFPIILRMCYVCILRLRILFMVEMNEGCVVCDLERDQSIVHSFFLTTYSFFY